jgi:hypothetical protein
VWEWSGEGVRRVTKLVTKLFLGVAKTSRIKMPKTKKTKKIKKN